MKFKELLYLPSFIGCSTGEGMISAMVDKIFLHTGDKAALRQKSGTRIHQ